MNRIRTAITAALLASFVGLQAAPATAQAGPRNRYEDRDRRDDKQDRKEADPAVEVPGVVHFWWLGC